MENISLGSSFSMKYRKTVQNLKKFLGQIFMNGTSNGKSPLVKVMNILQVILTQLDGIVSESKADESRKASNN